MYLHGDSQFSALHSNVGILLIGALGTNFSDIRIELNTNFCHENAFEMVAILPRCEELNWYEGRRITWRYVRDIMDIDL